MTLAERIALVLSTEDRYPTAEEIDEWDREIFPWRRRMSELYDELKRQHDFQTSARRARATVVEEMIREGQK